LFLFLFFSMHSFLFFFWWDWGLNSALCLQSRFSIPWATPPVHFAVILEMGVSWTICLGQPQTMILLNSASQVAGIIDMSHQCPSQYAFLKSKELWCYLTWNKLTNHIVKIQLVLRISIDITTLSHPHTCTHTFEIKIYFLMKPNHLSEDVLITWTLPLHLHCVT
jgi:hypothetical protein